MDHLQYKPALFSIDSNKELNLQDDDLMCEFHYSVYRERILIPYYDNPPFDAISDFIAEVSLDLASPFWPQCRQPAPKAQGGFVFPGIATVQTWVRCTEGSKTHLFFERQMRSMVDSMDNMFMTKDQYCFDLSFSTEDRIYQCRSSFPASIEPTTDAIYIELKSDFVI